MRQGKDISARFAGLYIVHHNLPGKREPRHSHDEHVVFFPLRGEISVELDGKVLSAGPGRLIYLPPEAPHAFESGRAAGERLIVLIDPQAWKRAGITSAGRGRVRAAPQLCKELLFYLLLNPRTKHAPSLAQTFIQALGESLEQGACSDIEHIEGRARDPRLRAALELLRAPEAPAMSVLARRSGLSARSLNRLFHDELGVTPKQALIQFRIDRSKQSLSAGASVTEAALEAGYRSLAAFIAAFRQVTGQLPSEFARFGGKQ